jgi:hypothetical protein
MGNYDYFKLLCIYTLHDTHTLEVECPKLLWGICGPKDKVMTEAFHYFMQYYNDGEYNQLIKDRGEPYDIQS